jgi:hypothetical protein
MNTDSRMKTYAFLAFLLGVFFVYEARQAKKPAVRPGPSAAVAESASPVNEPNVEPPATAVAEPAPVVAPPPAEAIDEAKVKNLRAMAKASLSGFYSAQRAYFAEFGRYTTDLKTAGWLPDKAQMEYKAGFLREGKPNKFNDFGRQLEDPRRMNSDAFLGEKYDRENYYAYSDQAAVISLDQFAQFCEKDCSANELGFEMILAVPLDGAGRVDVWRVNQNKEIVLVQDGLIKKL